MCASAFILTTIGDGVEERVTRSHRREAAGFSVGLMFIGLVATREVCLGGVFQRVSLRGVALGSCEARLHRIRAEGAYDVSS